MPEHRLTERDLPLKGSRLYRRKDSGGAGAETPTVPFPYQKAKGGYAPNLGGTTKHCALVPKHRDGSVFLRFFRGKAARSEKIPYYLSEKEHDYG